MGIVFAVLLASAEIISPNVGMWFELPIWMPRSVSADRQFGSSTAIESGTHRLTPEHAAAYNAILDGWYDRCYHHWAGTRSVWGEAQWGSRSPGVGFLFDPPAAGYGDCPVYVYHPDTNRVISASRRIFDHAGIATSYDRDGMVYRVLTRTPDYSTMVRRPTWPNGYQFAEADGGYLSRRWSPTAFDSFFGDTSSIPVGGWMNGFDLVRKSTNSWSHILRSATELLPWYGPDPYYRPAVDWWSPDTYDDTVPYRMWRDVVYEESEDGTSNKGFFYEHGGLNAYVADDIGSGNGYDAEAVLSSPFRGGWRDPVEARYPIVLGDDFRDKIEYAVSSAMQGWESKPQVTNMPWQVRLRMQSVNYDEGGSEYFGGLVAYLSIDPAAEVSEMLDGFPSSFWFPYVTDGLADAEFIRLAETKPDWEIESYETEYTEKYPYDRGVFMYAVFTFNETGWATLDGIEVDDPGGVRYEPLPAHIADVVLHGTVSNSYCRIPALTNAPTHRLVTDRLDGFSQVLSCLDRSVNEVKFPLPSVTTNVHVLSAMTASSVSAFTVPVTVSVDLSAPETAVLHYGGSPVAVAIAPDGTEDFVSGASVAHPQQVSAVAYVSEPLDSGTAAAVATIRQQGEVPVPIFGLSSLVRDMDGVVPWDSTGCRYVEFSAFAARFHTVSERTLNISFDAKAEAFLDYGTGPVEYVSLYGSTWTVGAEIELEASGRYARSYDYARTVPLGPERFRQDVLAWPASFLQVGSAKLWYLGSCGYVSGYRNDPVPDTPWPSGGGLRVHGMLVYRNRFRPELYHPRWGSGFNYVSSVEPYSSPASGVTALLNAWRSVYYETISTMETQAPGWDDPTRYDVRWRNAAGDFFGNLRLPSGSDVKVTVSSRPSFTVDGVSKLIRTVRFWRGPSNRLRDLVVTLYFDDGTSETRYGEDFVLSGAVVVGWGGVSLTYSGSRPYPTSSHGVLVNGKISASQIVNWNWGSLRLVPQR